jgi:hypothetical protein
MPRASDLSAVLGVSLLRNAAIVLCWEYYGDRYNGLIPETRIALSQSSSAVLDRSQQYGDLITESIATHHFRCHSKPGYESVHTVLDGPRKDGMPRVPY